MAKNSFQFDVALGKNNYIPIGEVKQSDTMDFSIRVLENDVVKNLTGDTCTLYVSKQDGTILEQKEGINITEATSGTLTIRVKNQATACPGMTFFELEFKGADGIATSGTFLFTVNARLASGEAIQSKDEIQALEQVEKYVKEAKVELQKFKELQAAMLETNNSLNNQEELRVEAESLRVTAEAGRVAAETKREEAFNKFEGRITANTEELETARTATTGENFNSIDERIDCEVERINKNIEISFLEQEAKESHIIENTIEGMTTDMRIGGRTLVNLFTVSRSHIAEHNKQCVCESDNKEIYTNKQYSLINLISKSIAVNVYKKNPSGYLRTITLKGNSVVTVNLSENEYIYSNNGVYDGSEWNGTQVDLELLERSLLVLEGDWANKPIPQYFEGLKSLGESEQEGDKYKISILSTGRNLINDSEKNNIEIVFADGTEHVNNKVVTTGFTPFFKNTSNLTGKVTIKNIEFNPTFRWYDKDKKYIGGDNLNNIPSNAKFIRMRVFDSINPINPSDVKFMLVDNEDNTTYEPYEENKKDILIKETLKESDYLYEDNGQVKVHREAKEYTFTGNEDGRKENTLTNTTRFYIDTLCKNKLNTRKIICNNFNSNGTWYDRDEVGMYWDMDIQGRLWFHIKNGKFNDFETFKNFLKANQTVIVYQLSEPTIEIVENCNNLNLKTCIEKTYVSFENSISGTSSFKVPVNAAATISRLNRENKALEEENLRLKKGTYKNSEDIILTNEELQITQSAVDHLLFGAVGTAMLYNGKKKGGGSMGAYLAMRIIKGKLKYDAVMKQYGEFKEDIDMILKAEGCGHLITQQ